MTTEIKTWQITDGTLQPVNSTLAAENRKEKDHLEAWLKTNSSIIGGNIVLIGEQVFTKSGPLDFLGLDEEGNTVIVELKRDKLAREVLAQAIDYASDVDTFSVDKLSEISLKHTGKNLEEVYDENFPEVNIEELSINLSQRIILVGFGIEESLTRMVEWLASKSEISINAVLLSYVVTTSGDELLSRTVILPESEASRKSSSKKWSIARSDVPGSYDDDTLRKKLSKYLSSNLWSVKRLNNAVIPALLKADRPLKRGELLNELIENADAEDTRQAGYFLALISNQLGQENKDFLRQIINYEYPNHPWEKDNFSMNDEYRDLVEEVLIEVSS